MNLNCRERGYGELREAVIGVMLDAGENGVDSFDRLLNKTALELSRRDEATPAPPGSRRPAPGLHPNDSELALEIVWDLIRQGIVTFGLNAPNSGQPWLRCSRLGQRELGQGAHAFHDNSGFLRAVRWEAADVSPGSIVYLREAVSAFYMDCLLSACVMLGIAAENEFLRLLAAAKDSKAHGRYFSRIGDRLGVATKISQFKDAIRPIQGLLPGCATDEFDHNLSAMQSLIRTARSESGPQSGVLPPTRDQAHLYLQLFIPFARQAARLRQEFNDAAYPRLVRTRAVSTL